MGRMILDKNAVQGANAKDLWEMSRRYKLVLPVAFFYEVGTQGTHGPPWRNFYRKLLRTRPEVCRRVPTIVRGELRSRLPVQDIIDRRVTEKLHGALARGVDRWPEPSTVVSPRAYRMHVRRAVGYVRERLRNAWSVPSMKDATREYNCLVRQDKTAGAFAQVRTASEATAKREWKAARRPESLCTERCLAFMEVWIRNFQCFVLAANAGAPQCDASDETIFNQCLDTEYLLLLVGADGIVSREQWVQDMARAFFPKAQVFACVAEAIA